MKRVFLFTIDTLLLCAFIGVFYLFIQETKPTFSNATYSFEGEDPISFDWPLKVKKAPEYLEVNAEMYLPKIYPHKYRIIPDDCLEELWINDMKVEDEIIPFCQARGRSVSLGGYIHKGNNHIRARIKNNGRAAKFNILVDTKRDPIFLFAKILLAGVILTYGFIRLR